MPRLYLSLCRQTNQNFEWIIVDDGSTDDTAGLVRDWQQENKLKITYRYKENGGKASAYNIGTKEAKGDYFVCVDSDDYLKDDAVEKVLSKWKEDKEIKINDEEVIGQIFFRETEEGNPITAYNGNAKYETLLAFYREHGLRGDTMLIYRSDVVKKYQFPIYDEEKFVPESYIYDQYDEEGVLRLIPEGIYVGEYLSDGYTASIRKINHDNPRGYETFIRNRLDKDDRLIYRFQDMIRYVAIKIVLKDRRMWTDSKDKLLTLISLIPGWLFYRITYAKFE